MNLSIRYDIAIVLCLVLSAVTLTHAIKAVATKDLDQLARSHDVVVVFLQSNQEGHKEQVERLTGEIEGIEARFNQVLRPDQITFVSIDAEAHPDIVTRLHVSMVPALHVIREGRSREYLGQRMGLVFGDWLQRLFTVPAVRALDTKTQRKQFSDEDHESVHVIGYLDQGTTNKETFDTFSRVARHFQNDIDFLLVTRADAAKSLKIKRDNSLVIYRPSEKPHVIEEVNQYDFAALVKQINELNTPLYQDFSFFNVFRVFAGSKPKVIAAVSESKEQSQDVLNAFKSAAKNLQDEFDFVLFNGGIFGAFLPLVGLDVSQLPTLAIVGIKGLETVWDPEQQVTNKAVLNWLREWHAAQPREVEIPVFSAESAVKHLDLAALNAVLQGTESRHVFVEFYAQWCVNCRTATPVWEQLAAQLSTPLEGHELVVGAFDIDQEALPIEAQLNVSVLPSFLFWRAHNSTPAYYHGPVTLADLAQFVTDQLSVTSEEKKQDD
jgi:thioredoxin-like negative regulator of GroEL